MVAGLGESMKTGVIWTAKGEPILVDIEDLPMLSEYTWFLGRSGYVRAWDGRGQCSMHRLLLPESTQVDHINRDKLDNRRSNLRPATAAQNAANRRSRRGSSSKYKGVYWDKKHGCWHASIKIAGRSKHLGSFRVEEDAAKAYQNALVAAFGEFASW